MEEVMLPTYPAILRDGHIEWSGDAPPGLTAERRVEVLVTLPEAPPAPPDQGRRMAAALEKLFGSEFSKIPDPVAWQREQRIDRDLPGRDE